mgnify:FL=1
MEPPRSCYNNNVLLGNWFNDKAEFEHKFALYLKQKERRKLLTLRVRNVFDYFLKSVNLCRPTWGLSFGGPFQLLGNNPLANGFVFRTDVEG